MAESKSTKSKTTAADAEKHSISPLERYRMVAEAAYYRAEKRGFVIGNPIEDWIEAEREIDAKYAVDLSKLFSGFADTLTKLRSALAVRSSEAADLSAVLKKEHATIEALVSANQALVQDVGHALGRQAEIVRSALEGTLSGFQSLPKEDTTLKALAAQQRDLAKEVLERTLLNATETAGAVSAASGDALATISERVSGALTDLQSLASKLAAKTGQAPEGAVSDVATMNVEKALHDAYKGRSLKELLAAPVSALSEVSESDAKALQEALGIKTVRALAENKYFNWALSITKLAKTES